MRGSVLAVMMLVLAIVARAESLAPMPSPAEVKQAMEKKIVNEVTGILDRFIGPGRAHVTAFLNIDVKANDLALPGKSKSRQNATQARWMWREISKKPKMGVLPGFTVAPDVSVTDNKESKTAPPASQQPSDAEDAPFELDVRQVLVSIVLDNTVSEKDQKEIEVIVSEVLGLDPDRGDRLNVYRLPLQPAWKAALDQPDVLVRLFWALTWLAIVAFVLFFAARSVRGVLEAFSLLPARKEKTAGQRLAESEPASRPGTEGPPKTGPAAANAKAEESSAKKEDGKDVVNPQRLDFVTHDNLEMLAELLKDCDPKETACVVGFLEPSLSSRILGQLAPDKRVETLMYLVSATSVPPSEMAEIRRIWRDRLAFAYGGTGAVGELLSTMDPAMQNIFLERLGKASPDLSARVNQSLIRMDDLLRLDDKDLAQVLQAVTYEDWAKALASMPDSFRERLLSVMPEASRKILEQWLSLTVKTKPADIVQAQMRVFGVMRSLLRQGKISFVVVVPEESVVLAAPLLSHVREGDGAWPRAEVGDEGGGR